MSTYLMTSRYIESGEVGETTESVVDEQYLDRFTNASTRAFFEGLGGQESLSVVDGVTYVRSVSPDGETIREVTFTPAEVNA